MLKSKELDTRAAAVEALGDLGELAYDCEPDIRGALHDGREEVRMVAVKALAKHHSPTHDMLPELRKLADDRQQHSSVAETAKAAIREIESAGKDPTEKPKKP
jgi:HEAT repeat protein